MADRVATGPIQSSLRLVAGIAGGLGGWMLCAYSGAAFAIPMVAAFVLFLVFEKTSLRPQFFAPVVAVTGGHIFWFISAAVVTGEWLTVLPDIALLGAGIIWIWVRPGLGPVVFLGIIQLLSLLVNGVDIASIEVGTPEHRALTVHCVLRTFSLAALVAGYFQLRTRVACRDEAAENNLDPENDWEGYENSPSNPPVQSSKKINSEKSRAEGLTKLAYRIAGVFCCLVALVSIWFPVDLAMSQGPPLQVKIMAGIMGLIIAGCSGTVGIKFIVRGGPA